MMRMGDCYFEGIGVEIDNKLAMKYYHQAEMMFYDRLENGDFMIKGCYDKVVRRQAEARQKLEEQLSGSGWTK